MPLIAGHGSTRGTRGRHPGECTGLVGLLYRTRQQEFMCYRAALEGGVVAGICEYLITYACHHSECRTQPLDQENETGK